MMLDYFSVSNYKNFGNTVTLDFRKSKDYPFNQNLIRDGLINKALLIGVNGSGKTNLGLAIFDIVYTLTDSIADSEQVDESTFINGDSDLSYAEFSYGFQSDGSRFRYTYRKTAPRTIIYESLSIDDSVVFIRDGSISDYSGLDIIGAESLRVDSISDGPLAVMRYVHNNTVQTEDSPVSRIMAFIEGMLYLRSTQDGCRFIGPMRGGETPEMYVVDNGLVDGFEEFLHETGKVDMELGLSRGPFGDLLVQRTAKKDLLFGKVASSGTKALLDLYYCMNHFKDISFLFMDGFDVFYHHEVAVRILSRMCVEGGFQTVFTSHNTSLIDNGIMRPDCYMVLRDGCIWLFPELTDRELRQGHSLEKMLRNGVFDD
ncbi:MAG: AAA family ATPase [Candidatus Methanomethylophilaceae archaeon]|nr:AAA family ATPase [Candidatus Methanomethylophilaceae archaeon]